MKEVCILKLSKGKKTIDVDDIMPLVIICKCIEHRDITTQETFFNISDTCIVEKYTKDKETNTTLTEITIRSTQCTCKNHIDMMNMAKRITKFVNQIA